MKKIKCILLAALLFLSSAMTISADAGDGITAKYYSTLQQVMVSGEISEEQLPLPVCVYIVTTAYPTIDDILYIAQFHPTRAGRSQFVIPANVDGIVDECYAGVSIGGESMTFIQIEEAMPIEITDWYINNNVLNLSGRFFCLPDSCTLNLSIENADGDVVLSSSVDANPADYTYLFSVDLSGIEYGSYQAIVSADGYECETTIEHLDLVLLLQRINAVRNDDTLTNEQKGQALKTILVNPSYNAALQLGEFVFDTGITLDNANNQIYTNLSQCKNDITSKAELETELLKAYYAYLYNNATTTADFYNVLCTKAKDIVDFETLQTYEYLTQEFTDAEQLAIFVDIKNANIGCYDDIVAGICDEVIIKVINKAIFWTDLRAIVNNNPDVFGTTLTLTTNGWSSILEGLPYADVDAFVAAINAYEEPAGGDLGGGIISGGITSSGGDITGGGSVGMSATVVQSDDYTSKKIFSDLGGVEWATNAINTLYELKIINGKADNVFAPYDNVTREEFVKMLVGLVEISGVDYNSDFTDVDSNAWYYEAISKANFLGITKGKADGSFGIGEPITRQDAAVMVFRTMQLSYSQEIDVTLNFSDVEIIADYALEAVGKLASLKVINGMGNNCFEPNGMCTRAQAAQIIYSVYNVINSK